ncbi:MAG: hypothetical protein K0R75_1693 [Paenibacillaceae bacterium]|nr:hypothetical protein [Paenibacillaceae bacterium]
MNHENQKMESIQWERMLPQEFRAAFDRLPVVYLPLGTVEWHGEHNVIGLDSLKAHRLCVMAAQRSGGIVHPPLYGGMGGERMPATVRMEEEDNWDNYLLRPWLEKYCYEFQRLGFRSIIILTGHYSCNQQIVVKETAIRMTERLCIPVLGVPEFMLAQDVGYSGDHAGIGETSLMMHLHPEYVRMDRILSDPQYGKDDRIINGASAERGEKYTETIVERLSKLAVIMPLWDGRTIADFVQAERALLNAQVKGWRNTGSRNTAWQRMAHGEHNGYGRMLVEERFDELKSMAEKLL